MLHMRDAPQGATGTPAGWSRRAASRALQAGKRSSGVYAVELRPGGAARYFLQRREDTGHLDTQGRQWGEKPYEPQTGRRHHTASAERPRAESASVGEAANTDQMAVDAGQETSKARHRSQQRLASHGKAMGYLKGLVFKRRMDWSRATGEAAAGEATTSRGGRQR
jgi:hypothetical protein